VGEEGTEAAVVGGADRGVDGRKSGDGETVFVGHEALLFGKKDAKTSGDLSGEFLGGGITMGALPGKASTPRERLGDSLAF
jgi:hypothetical protein